MATERNQTALHLSCLSSPWLTSRSLQEPRQRDEFLHIQSIWWEVFSCKYKLEVSIKKQATKNVCQLMSRFTHPLVVLRVPCVWPVCQENSSCTLGHLKVSLAEKDHSEHWENVRFVKLDCPLCCTWKWYSCLLFSPTTQGGSAHCTQSFRVWYLTIPLLEFALTVQAQEAMHEQDFFLLCFSYSAFPKEDTVSCIVISFPFKAKSTLNWSALNNWVQTDLWALHQKYSVLQLRSVQESWYPAPRNAFYHLDPDDIKRSPASDPF